MSVNKDLEIIKANIKMYMYAEGCPDGETAISAAERMAEEIERLKKIIHLCDYCQKEYPTCDAPKDIDFGRGKGNDNVVRCAAFVNGRNLWAEISRLKAELEKRPEIINCGDCKKWQTDECPRRRWDTNYLEHFDPESDGHCEHGQRRESKEGK